MLEGAGAGPSDVNATGECGCGHAALSGVSIRDLDGGDRPLLTSNPHVCYTPDLICDKLNDIQRSLDRLSISNDVDALSSE